MKIKQLLHGSTNGKVDIQNKKILEKSAGYPNIDAEVAEVSGGNMMLQNWEVI